jgi:hypothetical protein
MMIGRISRAVFTHPAAPPWFNVVLPEPSFTISPEGQWSCNHRPDYSEIVAYLPSTGKHEVIADICDGAGIDAEVLAGLIARAVNRFEKNNDVIEQMTAAIELCLTCAECLSWEAEHDAQAILKRVKEKGRGQGTM